MQDVLYCFDDNYNTQALVSIYSVLENLGCKINLNIIHKVEIDENFLPDKILRHKNLNFINVKKFDNKKIKYFNISTSHVTEATFYRIYLEDYLDTSIKNILYLDCDILCYKDGFKKVKQSFLQLKTSEFVFGAVTENIRSDNEEFFKRLNLSGEKYFNAGVLFINLERWKSSNIKEKAISAIDILQDKAKLWDQDILNYCVDGKYLEIENSLNYKSNYHISQLSGKIENDNVIFYHYSGSSKPWEIRGPSFAGFELFQDMYRKLFNKKYYLESKSLKKSLKEIFIILKNKDFKRIEYVGKYFFHSLIALFFKRNS